MSETANTERDPQPEWIQNIIYFHHLFFTATYFPVFCLSSSFQGQTLAIRTKATGVQGRRRSFAEKKSGEFNRNLKCKWKHILPQVCIYLEGDSIYSDSICDLKSETDVIDNKLVYIALIYICSIIKKIDMKIATTLQLCNILCATEIPLIASLANLVVLRCNFFVHFKVLSTLLPTVARSNQTTLSWIRNPFVQKQQCVPQLFTEAVISYQSKVSQ